MTKISPIMVGGGGHAHPFTVFTITYKVVVYASAKRKYTLPPFLLYTYMYSVSEPKPLLWGSVLLYYTVVFKYRGYYRVYSMN